MVRNYISQTNELGGLSLSIQGCLFGVSYQLGIGSLMQEIHTDRKTFLMIKVPTPHGVIKDYKSDKYNYIRVQWWQPGYLYYTENFETIMHTLTYNNWVGSNPGIPCSESAIQRGT